MTDLVSLQCGTRARNKASTFCGRCGLPYGAPPRSEGELAACHICYKTTGEDGKFDSLDVRGLRVDLQRHMVEHERHAVGDDEYLESLREGDRIRIGRWTAWRSCSTRWRWRSTRRPRTSRLSNLPSSPVVL